MPDEVPTHSDAWVTTRLAHLQMLQALIDRMSATSGQIKVASTAMVTAVLSVAAGLTDPHLAIVALPVTILLGALDAYYLSLERGFRDKFDGLRVAPVTGLADFSMQTEVPPTLRSAFLSLSIWPYYSSLLGIVIATFLLIEQGPPIPATAPTQP